MIELLVVVAERRIMGEIRRKRGGRLNFVYDDSWRTMDAAYPLSLSMPLAVAEHGHANTAKRQRPGRNKQAEAPFIQIRRKGLKPAPDALNHIHAPSESYFDSKGNPSKAKRFACFATNP